MVPLPPYYFEVVLVNGVVSHFSQAGRSQASLEDNTLSPTRSALSQAGSSQASPADSTPARSVPSQAGSPQASLGDSTLSSAESALSQVGSPQKGISQASPADSTLSPAESELSQGSFPSSWRIALSRQRGLYLLRQSGAQQGLGLGRQATPLGRSPRSLSETVLSPKGYFPRTMLPKRQGPSPVGTTPHRVLPPWRNLTQSG